MEGARGDKWWNSKLKKKRKNSRSKLQAVGRLAWPQCYDALVRNTDSSVIIIKIIDQTQ